MAGNKGRILQETLALAILAVGSVVVFQANTTLSSVGIVLIALGWCRWFDLSMRSHDEGSVGPGLTQRCSWILTSATLIAIGTLGADLRPELAPFFLVSLLVGGSAWCLVSGHESLLIVGDSRQSWMSLLIAAALSRCAALILLVRVVIDTGRQSGEISQSLIECLLAAGLMTCVFAIVRTWTSRSQRHPQMIVASVVQVQTAIVLGTLAAETWTSSPSESHWPEIFPWPDSLPVCLVVWDAFVVCLFCIVSSIRLKGHERTPLTSWIAGLLLCDMAALPPTPGFWFRWWSLQTCLEPHHVEPFAGMFDQHDGFRALSIALTVAQAGVAIRLLHLCVTALPPHDVSSVQDRSPPHPVASLSHE